MFQIFQIEFTVTLEMIISGCPWVYCVLYYSYYFIGIYLSNYTAALMYLNS